MSLRFRRIVISLIGVAAIAQMAPAAHAVQPAAPYAFATRYNESGQVTGTISPDPDGGGALHFLATRNTFGTSGAVKGLLTKAEKGELAAWADETVAPNAWGGFTIYLTTVFTYDSLGRKATEALIGSNAVTESLVQYSYDDWNRVRCKAVRMNKSAYVSLPADTCLLGPEGAYGKDRISRYTYDTFDQVLREERALGTSLEQTYVTNVYAGPGILTSQTDAKGNRTELRYNTNWRLDKRVYPSSTSAGSVNESDYNQYGYDNNGNVTYERKRNIQTIANTIDANNRLTFKNLSDNTYSGDVTYNYDLRGLTLSSCFGSTDACVSSGEGETNTFDGFGNLSTRTSRMTGAVRTLGYRYDREGNRMRVTHPDGWFFEYGFDGLNRVNSLNESVLASPAAATTLLLTISYRPSGGRLDLIRPSGAVTNINFDNALRLGSFTQNFAVTANDLTNGFEYNPANQITKLSQSNSLYTYAELGSRAGSYTPNGLNQIANIAGSAVTYDIAGNLVSDAGVNMGYTYDMENHLVSTSGAVASNLTYDVLGRLYQANVGGTTTQFHYDGDALVGEYVGGALQRRYVHGDQVDEPLVQYNLSNVGSAYRRYLHADHQGSVIAQSDGSGAAIVKNAFDPYGIPASTNEGRFGYTGQTWLKELGLNYYKARLYSPKLGRFLQSDPIFYKGDMNLYAYTGNDPFNATDPSGTNMVPDQPPPTPPPAPEPIGQCTIGDSLATGTVSAPTDSFFGNNPVGHAVGSMFNFVGLLNGGYNPVTGDILTPLQLQNSVGELALNVIFMGTAGTTTKVASTGLYEFTAVSGKTYVGQSSNIAVRLEQWIAAGKLIPGTPVIRTEVLGGKTAREIAEQLRINALGGVRNLENIRNPIGAARQYLLQ